MVFTDNLVLAVCIVFGCVIVWFLASFIAFLLVFYSPKRKPLSDDDYPLPTGKAYEPYYEQLRQWVQEVRCLEHTDVSIRSHDGLQLRGRYYRFYESAPIELMLHGYRGDSVRDLSGGVIRARRAKHNVLVVDNRASGRSDGHIITFGIKECDDCLQWIDFILKEIDSEAQIILAGVSMGASTVLLAAGSPLPKNVIGVLADCGFTSPEKIIKDVMRKIHVPVTLVYPLIAFGARVFGKLDLHSHTSEKAMRHATLPILFFHGDADDFVPMQMSVDNYHQCTSRTKRLVIIKKAGHGLCFAADQTLYLQEMDAFFLTTKKSRIIMKIT